MRIRQSPHTSIAEMATARLIAKFCERGLNSPNRKEGLGAALQLSFHCN
jgi:hypothetical protein